MGQAIPTQHPAVVLRSHYTHLRALLAVAMIAVVGLTAAVVILATDEDQRSTNASSATGVSAPGPAGIRYDGGPEEGTSGVRSALNASKPDSSTGSPGIRYDGGPEEGTSGVHGSSTGSSTTPGVRYDGGPEEGWALAR